MADVEHVDIADSQRHEPKGADAALVGQSYLSDGAQSGSWRYVNPHAALYYEDIGTGTTLTTPTTYAIINPTTVGNANPREFTHNSAGRLTYTGTTTMDFQVTANFTWKHSSATLVDTQFQFFVNGIAQANTQVFTSGLSGNYQSVTMHSDISLAVGDYVEVYAETASGDVIIHAMSLSVLGKV